MSHDVPPEKGWPVWAAGVLEAIRQNPSISRAAQTVGISRRTVHRWMQRDEEFALAVHDAREEALGRVGGGVVHSRD
jgi:molybdenum-dependent DNA-binding transcriptional regulator ModE